MDNLEKVWLTLGRQPTINDLRKPLSKYSSKGYKRIFGSWNNALKTFAEFKNKEAGGSKCKVKNTARKRKRGKSPNRNAGVKLRFDVMKRDKFKCVLCGRSPAKDPAVELEIDHIIPWSKGGETLPENLQTLCAECNNGKRDG